MNANNLNMYKHENLLHHTTVLEYIVLCRIIILELK